jgi:hypothetical protein
MIAFITLNPKFQSSVADHISNQFKISKFVIYGLKFLKELTINNLQDFFI